MGKTSKKTKMINWLKKNYTNMPDCIVYLIGKIGNSFSYKVRYGKDFYSTYEKLKETEFLSKVEIDRLVLNNLEYIIKYAYEHVPYYKEKYSDLNIEEFNSFEDIEKLPFLDKSIVRENTDKLISNEFDKKDLIVKATSGSTGMPLGLYMNKETTLKEWAFVVHIWEQIGYNKSSKRIIMRELDDKTRGNCYFDPIKQELRIDVSSMTDENMEIYCKAIEKYKPEFVHGYPSATILLCQYINKRGFLNHQFKGVLPSSEGMSLDEVNFVKDTLKCPVLSFYGHTERLVMAGQCKESESYHVEPLYGYCELIDQNGDVIHEKGITGEIVATGFCNTAMPLIRYKTGDLAQWGEECQKCGKHYKVLEKLEGRTTEYLVGMDNTKIPLTSFSYSFYQQHLKAFQFYQEEIGKVTVRCIFENNVTDEDKEYVLNSLTQDSKNKIEFKLESWKELSRKTSGKRELIIQKLK